MDSPDLWTSLRTTLARRANTLWNWCLHRLALAVLGLALLAKSGLLAATGIIFLGVGFLDLHLPPLSVARLIRLQAAEQRWLDAPWDRRKRFQAVVLVLAGLLVVWGLWRDDLVLLVLLAGGLGLWRAWAENRDLGVDEPDEGEEEAEDEQ